MRSILQIPLLLQLYFYALIWHVITDIVSGMDRYLSLFDEHVIGWPALDNRPKGKSHVSQWITTVHADASQTWNYELNRLAIKAFGDVVVVHYLLRDYFTSAESGNELSSNLYRISHTWKRYGDEWKIVSGMGSPHD